MLAGEVSLRLRQPFKRQWARELWGALFHRLLNHSGVQWGLRPTGRWNTVSSSNQPGVTAPLSCCAPFDPPV